MCRGNGEKGREKGGKRKREKAWRRRTECGGSQGREADEKSEAVREMAFFLFFGALEISAGVDVQD